MAKDKILYGLSEVHYAIATETVGSDGKITTTYGDVKPWKGAVSLSADAQGQNDNFYADDYAYAALENSTGYDGTLEMANVPDDVLVDVFNFIQPTEGGVLESANAKTNYIALMFKFDGDANGRKHVFYRVRLGRPAVAGNTKTESVDPKTQSLSLKATPRADDGYIKWHVSKDDTAYANFFNSVTIPTVSSNDG